MNRHHTVPSAVCIIFSLILAIGSWGVVEAVGYPFSDDFESGLGNWSAAPPWGATTAFYASPVYSATDSPSTYYGTSSDASLSLGSSVDLRSATRPVLRFRHRHQLEDGYDFGYVELSTDGGSSWSETLATYTGTRGTWTREQLDLASYIGEADVRIRFRLVSDGTVNADGWYVDDVAIAEAPEAVVLDPPFAVEANSLELTWSQSAATDFAAYRVYRSASPGVDWRTAALVAEITNVATTGHTDITVTPKTSYSYLIMVLTSAGLHSLSNEETATTPAGMDYPFLDNGEGTGTAWSAQGTWALSDEAAFSGSHAWSDSPGADYGNGIAAQSLTLVSPVDLTSASTPVLSFVHSYVFAAGDSGYVEISADGGSSWTAVDFFTNGDSGGWLRERIDLSSWTWSDDVLVRFRITTDPSTTADGWHVDDISVAESPTVVPPPILDQVTSHSMRLTWSQNTDLLFSHYAIHRSPSPGTGIQSTLVAEIFDQGTTVFTDSGLAVETDYYYRVYAVSPYGTYSPNSSSESTDRTGGNPYPFFEDFEGSLDSWNLEGDWNSTDTDKHGGERSLTDSPGTTSAPSKTYAAWTSIDLSGSSWPVLRFADRYAMANDWAFLDVSPNGTNWYRVYSATQALPTWTLRAIDLSPWRTATNLRIRFTVQTGSTVFDDGWYIDDLSVAEHSGSVSIPFFDDLESGTGNWLTSSWTPSADTPHSGAVSLRSTPNGTMSSNSQNAMELAGEFDLSGTTNPQLTFWLRGAVGDDGGFASQISTDDGLTWASLPNAGIGQYWSGGWTRFQVPLSSYIQSGVRFRFLNTNGNYGGPSDLFVDDVSIEEMPDNVTLATPDQISISSMRLSWNDLNEPDFAAYAVYRSQTPTVDTGSELVATITEQTTTEFVDTGLQARTTYYYRVYFVDTVHVYSPSNSTSGTTLGVTMPFADDFETDSGVWTFTGDWGRILDAGVGGSDSLGDSPGDFTSNVDTWALTAVNLTDATWPVVTFSERFEFAGHWGRFEISSDSGAHWTVLHGATTSQTGWVHRRFDLSPWRGQPQVWIRFFVDANSGVPADGWHIDNLYIGENPIAGSSGYPFFDGFEDGNENWLQGGWTLTDDNPYEGSTSILDTPASRLGNSELWLTYGSELDLSDATDPLLTFQVRGNTPDNNYFRGQVSTNGGITWQDLSAIYIHDNQSLPSWTRMQTSLSGYLVANLRLRFRVYGNYGGDSNIFLDNIAVGEQTPAAPTLNAPTMGFSEPTVRPTLVVNNAVDYQSDPMTYHFQVFGDSELTDLIAEVPGVAGGTATTAWEVDVDLLPDTQYWWRCRATDDTDHTGPWMEAATFFIQLTDHPPTVPVLLGPSDGGQLPDLTGRLTWLESTDPDEDNGDYVAGYRVQVDDDPAFGSIEIDEPSVTMTTKATGAISVNLAELSGSANLILETRYYWRVNARDSHGGASAWSDGPAHFVFGTDQTAAACSITSPTDDATVTASPITITGSSADALSGVDFVEISTDGGTNWVQAVGAESWSHQWWPALSDDYTLSCRATDLAENEGTASVAITVHADLDRTMAFAQATASVNEDAGTFNVTVTLSAARATEVTAELVVSGNAESGADFDEPPQIVRFFPGQTTLVFPLTITDDDQSEGNETISLSLGNTNISDITIGTAGTLTLTIVDNDVEVDPQIFADGFEEHGDLSAWSSHTP